MKTEIINRMSTQCLFYINTYFICFFFSGGSTPFSLPPETALGPVVFLYDSIYLFHIETRSKKLEKGFVLMECSTNSLFQIPLSSYSSPKLTN